MTLGDNTKAFIKEIGKVSKSLSQAINNIYHVDGLKHNLLNISQLCDKGN